MNRKNEHPIDALSRELLVEAQVEPREELWAAISAGVVLPAKRRGRFLLWLWIPAVAAVVGLLLLFTLQPASTESDAIVTDHPVEPTQTDTPAPGTESLELKDTLPTTSGKEAESAPGPLFGNGNQENSQPGKYRQMPTGTSQEQFPSDKDKELNHPDDTIPKSLSEEPTPVLIEEEVPSFKTLDPAPNKEPKTSNPILREQMLHTPLYPPVQGKETVALDDWNENAFRERKRRGGGKWKLGGQFAPEYAFAGSNPAGPTEYPAAGPAQLDENGNTNYAPTTAFSTGVRTEYKVSERVGVRSGLLYTLRRGKAGGLNSLNWVENTLFPEAGPQTFQTQYSFHFMEVPLAMRYNLLMRPKWNFFLSSGVSSNFFLSYSSTEQNSDLALDQTRTITQPFRPSQLNVLLGTGFEVALSRQLFLNLEPGMSIGAVTSRYSFTGTVPVSLTLNTGLNFGL